MIKRILLLTIITATFCLSVFVNPIFAHPLTPGDVCTKEPTHCPPDNQCQYRPATKEYQCTPLSGSDLIFGKITPPKAITDLGFGGGGISNFLNSLIILIYIIAGVVFVFMILWGAFEWLSSGGSKEGLESARKRIVHALIGIALFAIAFAVISLIGRFTGFTFFSTPTSIGCTTPSRHFIDPNTLKCIQTVHRNNVPYDSSGRYVMGKCVEVFIEVEDRFCK